MGWTADQAEFLRRNIGIRLDATSWTLKANQICNLYSLTKGQAATVALVEAMCDLSANLPPPPGIFPDYAAPVVRRAQDGLRELALVRLGMPTSKRAIFDAASKRADKLRAKGGVVDFDSLLRMEPDKGVTNVRNTTSAHWEPYLGPANRCRVPFISFCEPDRAGGSSRPAWCALDDTRPLACFAGIWKRDHTCVRKIKDGEVTCDLFAFLTTDANTEVWTYHAKAMPVILTTREERELWLGEAPWEEVRHLQRPLAGGALKVVVTGLHQDGAEPSPLASLF